MNFKGRIQQEVLDLDFTKRFDSISFGLDKDTGFLFHYIVE